LIDNDLDDWIMSGGYEEIWHFLAICFRWDQWRIRIREQPQIHVFLEIAIKMLGVCVTDGDSELFFITASVLICMYWAT